MNGKTVRIPCSFLCNVDELFLLSIILSAFKKKERFLYLEPDIIFQLKSFLMGKLEKERYCHIIEIEKEKF